MFRHPKYYKELRKLRNKTDQAISARETADDARATGPGHKLQAPSDSSHKLQASSPVAKASSFKPQASSAKIPDPGKSLTVPEPRASTRINVLGGCFTWKLI